ncbi:MAG TPA: hypothetical protein VF947_04640 [Myxococcales bacterium]
MTIAVVLCACTHGGNTVSKGDKCSIGNAWREYRSKHFLVYTDSSRDEAVRIVRELETLQALELQGLLGEQVEIPGRLRVIAMSDRAQFVTLTGNYKIAGYIGRGEIGEPIMVFPIVSIEGSSTREVVAHELAHHLSWFVFPRQPPWFSEGLAGWVQTVASDNSQEEPPVGTHLKVAHRRVRAAFGLAPREMTEWLTEAWVPIRELLNPDSQASRAQGPGFHLSSWLLYHWLWNNRSKEFSDYQRRLSNADDPVAAWRAALPEFDPAKPGAMDSLEGELDRYRRGGRYAFYNVATAEPDTAFTEAPLSSPDVHLLLLEGRMRWPEKQKSALVRAELEEALREDPENSLAIYRLSVLDGSSPLVALRKAATARPGDWRAWLSLGFAAARDSEEEEAAFRKAAELNSDSASAQRHFARVLANAGHMKEALPFANRAADLAPWDPAVLATLARVAMELGKCNEALVLQARAADLVDAKRGRPDYQKKLRDYEARCAKVASPAG